MQGDRMEVDDECQQRHGDASIPTPMHDVHAEIGVGVAHDPHIVWEQGGTSST